MLRIAIVLSLFFILGANLAGDQNGIKSSHELTSIIERYLTAREWIICDCAVPGPECKASCTPGIQRAWMCGTQTARREAAIEGAMEAGLSPHTIVAMILEYPAPFTPIAIVTRYPAGVGP